MVKIPGLRIMKNMLHIYFPLFLEREEKSLKPTNCFVVRGVLTLHDQGIVFSFPSSSTQPVSVSLLCVRTSCMIPSGHFYCQAAARKSVPEFMFSCTKRINRILK